MRHDEVKRVNLYYILICRNTLLLYIAYLEKQ